jgi:hypothetical protein
MKKTAIDRFREKYKVNDITGCWEWHGYIHPGGYGHFSDKHKFTAHRWSYEYFISKIPDNLQLDHLCRVRHCVNPNHLEAVTQKENILRGNTGLLTGILMKSKTHCPQNHEYSYDNTYIFPNGKRKCKECARNWQKNNKIKLRSKLA